jgi:hypothetical protein
MFRSALDGRTAVRGGVDVLLVQKKRSTFAACSSCSGALAAPLPGSAQPAPPAFRESVRFGEQNLYTHSNELVGDRNSREEEFSLQLRPMDADKTGAGLGVPVPVALCGGSSGRTRAAAPLSPARSTSVDPLYPRMFNALYYEFAEIGVNQRLEYVSPADLA